MDAVGVLKQFVGYVDLGQSEFFPLVDAWGTAQAEEQSVGQMNNGVARCIIRREAGGRAPHVVIGKGNAAPKVAAAGGIVVDKAPEMVG